MMSHWIIAPVVLPAVMGALATLVARNDLPLARVFGFASSLVLVAISVALIHAATTAPPEVYLLGNWPAPFGIVLVLDRLSALMVGLTAVLAVIVQLYAMGSRWDAKGRHFHALFLFQLMGINGAFLTGDAFNLFVFFEVLLIASYGLMIHSGGATRVKVGVQYIAFNLIGSSLFLFALAAIYALTGTLNIADLAVKVAQMPEGDAALLRATAVMLILVFAIKGALVPLQFWLPATYAAAPGPVAALFAVMTKIGAYAVIRFGNMVFPPETPATGSLIGDLMAPAAIVTLAIGAIGVLGARDLGRMAAFAAIASMGTAFIAVAAFTPAGTTAALYYMVHSTFAGAALFLIADLVIRRRGGGDLTAALPPMAQSGLLAGLFMAVAIGTAGMPPLSGFLGKLLVLDALRDQASLVWPVILGASLVMIFGLARAGSMLFWKSHETEGEPAPHGAEPLAITALGITLAALVAMTVFAGPLTDWLSATAQSVHDPAAYIAANYLPEVK